MRVIRKAPKPGFKQMQQRSASAPRPLVVIPDRKRGRSPSPPPARSASPPLAAQGAGYSVGAELDQSDVVADDE